MMLPREPRWRTADRLLRARLPTAVRGWLLDEASLTRHVEDLCPGRFHVRVLREGWRAPRADERCVLRLPPRTRVRIREVALHCGPQPLVLARTVMPATSLRGRQQRLIGIGRQPLGAVLFADRSMRRGPFAVCRTTLAQAGLPVVARGNELVYGRRALFHLGNGPLLVAEFFLPALIPSARCDEMGT